jgi:hypothetical protein
VGLEGTTEYRVFFLQFSDFNVPRRYVGINGKPVGHIIIEARKVADAPATPCVEGRSEGDVGVGLWRAALYLCPNDNPYIERVARHGEAANVGHILIEWRVAGVDYLASAHGHTTANLTLLRQLVGSVALVSPQG